MFYINSYKSPIGNIFLASDETHLIGLWFENQKYYMSSLKNKTYELKETEIIKQTKKWLDDYFNNKKPNPKDIKIKMIGTEFQKNIWTTLLTISYGETVTYKEITSLILKNKKIITSPRAVGSAISKNPISIIVPCHRVIGTSGSLTGYAGGLDKKQKLLKLEKGDVNEQKN